MYRVMFLQPLLASRVSGFILVSPKTETTHAQVLLKSKLTESLLSRPGQESKYASLSLRSWLSFHGSYLNNVLGLDSSHLAAGKCLSRSKGYVVALTSA